MMQKYACFWPYFRVYRLLYGSTNKCFMRLASIGAQKKGNLEKSFFEAANVQYKKLKH